MKTLRTIYLTTLHLCLFAAIGVSYGYMSGQLGGAPFAAAEVPQYIADTGIDQ